MTTYGERLLDQAERRIHGRKARRRILTLFAPGAVTAAWAVNDLLAVRIDRMQQDEAGLFAIVFGAALPILWTALFVILPLFAAVKADAMPSGAALGFAAGPVLTPMLFGPGGWRWWQIVVMFVICGAVLGAMVERARALRG